MKPLLDVRTVSAKAGKKNLLDNFSFEVNAGECVVLVGPNGSGKTTLLKLISGILSTPHEGDVFVGGNSLAEMAPVARAKKITYVGPELTTEFPLTVEQVIGMGQLDSKTNEKEIAGIMECTRCGELSGRMFYELSSGERQRVAFARALFQDPEVLILDEAVSKMDLNHLSWTWQALKSFMSRGRAVILALHDLNLVSEWASRCILLKNGKQVAQGEPGDVLTNDNLAHLYPGGRFEFYTNPINQKPKVVIL